MNRLALAFLLVSAIGCDAEVVVGSAASGSTTTAGSGGQSTSSVGSGAQAGAPVTCKPDQPIDIGTEQPIGLAHAGGVFAALTMYGAWLVGIDGSATPATLPPGPFSHVAGGTSFLLAGGTTLRAMAPDGQLGNETSIPAMNDYAQVAGVAAGSGYGVLFWDAKPWAPEDIPPQGPEYFYRADASAAIVAGPATVYANDTFVPMHDIGARPGGWTLVGALGDHFELRRVDDAGNLLSTSALPITDGSERGHALDGSALAWIVEASNGTGYMLVHADLEAPQPVTVLQGTDMRGPSIARADSGRFVAYLDENVMHLASLSDAGALLDDQVLTAAAVSPDTTAPLVAWSPSGVVAVAWHEYSAADGNRGRILLVRCRQYCTSSGLVDPERVLE